MKTLREQFIIMGPRVCLNETRKLMTTAKCVKTNNNIEPTKLEEYVESSYIMVKKG